MSQQMQLRKREIALFMDYSDLQPREVFAEILGDEQAKGKTLYTFLTEFKGSKSQINHFIQIIFLTEDINRWQRFIDHENNKRESPWKNEILKELMDKIQEWLKKPYDPNLKSNVVDNKLQELLNTYIRRNIQISDDIYKNWRLNAIRKAIYECLKDALRKGKQA